MSEQANRVSLVLSGHSKSEAGIAAKEGFSPVGIPEMTVLKPERSEASRGDFGLDSTLDTIIEELCFIRKIPFRELTEAFERRILVLTLSKLNGSQKEAAELLGLKASTLNEKIKKHRIMFRKEAV